MTTQPEALRLADEMLNYFDQRGPDVEAVAAELRRLHGEVEALKADAERLDWCISVLFGGGCLTTDVGCGCCGDGKSFDSDVTGRAAIDAVRGKA